MAAVAPERGEVMNDLYEALIETSTPVVRSAPEGVETLAALREALREAGATFIGGGLHPDAAFGDVVHVPLERYEAIRDSMRGLVSRTPTAALHVHVGMPDPDTAIAVYNRMRAHLPLLQALAAHSPFWHGRDSGLASARAVHLPRLPARHDPPAVPALGGVRRSHRAGARRPARSTTTRTCGGTSGRARTSARSRSGRWTRRAGWSSVCGLAALVHALAVACADGAKEVDAADRGAQGVLVPRRARRRRRDDLVARRDAADPRGRRRRARPRPPYARDLDGEDALEEIERILREGGGADRMRAAHAAGGMEAGC